MARAMLMLIVILLCVAVLIFTVVALLSNNSVNPNTQVASAKITDFSVEWTPLPTVVGMTSISGFTVTVENNGTVELSGLVVTIERMADDNKTNPDIYSYPNTSDYNFSLSIGQSKTIGVYIIAGMDRTIEYKVSHQNFLGTLSSNGTVLDTRQLFPSAFNPQQNPLPTTSTRPEVNITDFYLNGYSNPVGVAWNNAFVLHYINNGTTDVDNATITFNTNSTYKMDREILVFNSTPPHYLAGSNVMGEPYSLGIIKAGEAKEFHAEVINNLADSSKMGGFAFVATLKSNDTILDQATIMIPALG